MCKNRTYSHSCCCCFHICSPQHHLMGSQWRVTSWACKWCLALRAVWLDNSNVCVSFCSRGEGCLTGTWSAVCLGGLGRAACWGLTGWGLLKHLEVELKIILITLCLQRVSSLQLYKLWRVKFVFSCCLNSKKHTFKVLNFRGLRQNFCVLVAIICPWGWEKEEKLSLYYLKQLSLDCFKVFFSWLIMMYDW